METFLSIKIVVACSLFALACFFGLLPWILKSRFKNVQKVLSLCYALASGEASFFFLSGVILGMLLIHLMPEAVGGHHHFEGDNVHDHHDHSQHDHDHGNATFHNHSDHHHHMESGSEPIDNHFPWGAFYAGLSFFLMICIEKFIGCDHSHHCHNDVENPPMKQTEKNEYLVEEDKKIQKIHRGKSIIFVLALSIHSFLEGVGIGPISTQKRLVSFSTSLLAHKGLESFALGMNVMKSDFSMVQSVFMIITTALLTPIGCFIGIALQQIMISNHKLMEKVETVIMGLTLGTFLFIGCVEMIPLVLNEKSSRGFGFIKLFVLFLGFGLMALLGYFVPE